jgi:putative transposase
VVPNAVYFITAVTAGRRPLFGDPQAMTLLRPTVRNVKPLYPFRMHGYAFLPDHFHLLLHVPETTSISDLIGSIKWNTTRNYKAAQKIVGSTSLWQRSFWDHVIRDETDYEQHLEYIHYNPVKHGYVDRPMAYGHSSFAEYVRRGWYGVDWAESVEPQRVAGRRFE